MSFCSLIRFNWRVPARVPLLSLGLEVPRSPCGHSGRLSEVVLTHYRRLEVRNSIYRYRKIQIDYRSKFSYRFILSISIIYGNTSHFSVEEWQICKHIIVSYEKSCRERVCPANVCTSPVKLLYYTAGKTSTCPGWKMACPVGHLTTKVMFLWQDLHAPGMRACLNVEPCIYASVTYAIIGSDNGLSPGQRQAII